MEQEPITANELRVGVPYLHVGFDITFRTFVFEKFTILTKPHQSTPRHSLTACVKKQRPLSEGFTKAEESLEDMGLVPERRYNLHRTFKDTPEACAFFTQIIKNKDAVKYLSVIYKTITGIEMARAVHISNMAKLVGDDRLPP